MEQQLKEYFAKLSKDFWQPGNNPNIKVELGYGDQPDCDMSWFDRFFYPPRQKEAKDPVFSLNFYRFYNKLLEDEPAVIEVLKVIPFSYHEILFKNCKDPYDALRIIAFLIEHDWRKEDLSSYFLIYKDKGVNIL